MKTAMYKNMLFFSYKKYCKCPIQDISNKITPCTYHAVCEPNLNVARQRCWRLLQGGYDSYNSPTFQQKGASVRSRITFLHFEGSQFILNQQQPRHPIVSDVKDLLVYST